MTDAVLVCDHDGEIVSSNRAAAQLDLAAIITTIEEPACRAFQKMMRRVLRGETVTSAQGVEVTITLAHGEMMELSLSGSPFWASASDDAITPAGGVFVFHDITERRVAERKTADALNAMLMMVERLVAKNDDGSVAWANQMGQRLIEGAATALDSPRVALLAWDEETDLLSSVAATGFSASDPSWRFPDGQVRLADFLSAEDIAKLRRDIPISLDTSVVPPEVERDFETLLLIPARIRERLMGLMAVDARSSDAPGEITLAQAIARLAALLLERDWLDREREEAQSSARELEEANERLDTFLSMTGHELRTPLTNIRGYLQLAAMRMRPGAKQVATLAAELNPAQQEALADLLDHARAPLARAENETELMMRLVNDTLDAEAMRSGARDILPEPCDLVDVARAVIDTFHMRAPERSITLEASADVPMMVSADEQRIKQALGNCITNAVKYTPADCPIVVTVRAPISAIPPIALDQTNHQPDRPMAQVTVRDFGPGLPESEQKRIWDPFERATAPERRPGGLGLGLFIVRSIIQSHEGQTWVESAPGSGCAFSFTLPLCAEPSAQ
jgi:signal transduction histidine kinase